MTYTWDLDIIMFITLLYTHYYYISSCTDWTKLILSSWVYRTAQKIHLCFQKHTLIKEYDVVIWFWN